MISSKLSKYILILTMVFPLTANAATQLNLNEGGAKTIKVNRNIDTAFTSNPKVADYKVIDETRIVVYGKNAGLASVIIYDRSGNEVYNAEVIVNKSLRHVKQVLVAHFPGEEIDLSNAGNQVVLEGTVSSEEIKRQVERFVGEALNQEVSVNEPAVPSKDADSSGSLFYAASYNYAGVINNLKVLTTNQINVKLTVAEVSSSFLSQLGVSYSNTGVAGKFKITQLVDITAYDIVGLISAKDDDRIGQVLAEPNLSVISGETASFLVGGELPMVINGKNGPEFQFKEYGIKLSMVAKVLDVENIRLSLFPEVSSIDESRSDSNAFYTLPSLRTRRAQTTVQLKDGQSFVLAGLLTTEERESLSKIPILGDIPLLGALFSHSSTDRTKTELIIVATVNLVEPLESEKVKLPRFQATSDLERLLRIDLSGEQSQELEMTIHEGGFN
ncbi:pilus assembly protein N-terminal domain-containing protein [Vibrio sp. JC009]|uniref:type II and III secretion system protein family protein n=1 Tax=Vibrio sp. JC009 TaxID=2912314 RepID=UPI0023B1CCB1|nr:pilus assembly protein N-terminal domain-containing protein [Vibrio sp. JC009]WED24566.1 pilus assembly protein N-terminal domain-containing protein [Vibrio sp. JC009]